MHLTDTDCLRRASTHSSSVPACGEESRTPPKARGITRPRRYSALEPNNPLALLALGHSADRAYRVTLPHSESGHLSRAFVAEPRHPEGRGRGPMFALAGPPPALGSKNQTGVSSAGA